MILLYSGGVYQYNSGNAMIGILIIFFIIGFSAIIFISAANKAKQKPQPRRMDIPRPNTSALLERQKLLGADAAIGLMNLSGLMAAADEACGIYLFQDKILFETQEQKFELPFEQLTYVFTQKQNDVTRDDSPKRNADLTRALFLSAVPRMGIAFGAGLSALQKPKPNLIYSMEISLVFEYIKDDDSTDYIVFAVDNSQYDDAKNFIKLYEEHISKKQA